MRFTVVGVGGVGGLLGGLLARAGADVGLLARGRQLEALSRNGLRLEGDVGTFSIPHVTAADDASRLSPADVVLVAVKAWQVAGIAPTLKPLLAPQGFVVPLQNGVEAHDQLATALGDARVVGGLCHLIGYLTEPGVVHQSGGAPSVTVGEWSCGGSARLAELVATLKGAGIAAKVVDDIRAAVWEKALFVEPFGAVGAVIGLPAGRWRDIPESRRLLTDAMREIDSVAKANGVTLGEPAIERALARIDKLPTDATASLHRDLHAGRPSELQDQTGAIVRIAAARSVEVPIHRYLLAALLPRDTPASAKIGTSGS
jgi:2-dehydropantoate 2-reductase